MGLLIFAVSAAIAILALAEATIFIFRFPILGVWSVLLIFIWEVLSGSLPRIALGSVTVYSQDMIFFILLMVGTIRLIMQNKFTSMHFLWLVFGFLILASFARGVASYGFGPAGAEMRYFFYFFAGGLYFMSFPMRSEHLKRLALTWLYIAGALCLLALLRWVVGGFDFAVVQQWMDAEHGDMRVLNAAQAFFLVQAFLISLFLRLVPNTSRLWRSFSILLLPLVVLLQHRTVWVVALVSGLLAVLHEKKVRSRLLYVLMTAIIIGAILGLMVFGDNINKVPNTLSASVNEAVNTKNSTFIWRLEGWEALIAESGKFEYVDYLFGKPFGAGYARKVRGIDVPSGYTPHNYYIQTFLRLGLFGLITLLFTYVLVLRRLAQSTLYRVDGYFNSRLIFILLITQLIFFITYSPNIEQGIIPGLAIALVSQHGEEVTTSE